MGYGLPPCRPDSRVPSFFLTPDLSSFLKGSHTHIPMGTGPQIETE